MGNVRVSPKPLPSFYTRYSCRALLPSCLYRSLYFPVLFRLRLIYHDIYDCRCNIAPSLLYLCGLDPLSKEEAYIASLVLLRVTAYLNICILCAHLSDGYSSDVFMHQHHFSSPAWLPTHARVCGGSSLRPLISGFLSAPPFSLPAQNRRRSGQITATAIIGLL